MTEESIISWNKAGVACVGTGSKLPPNETLDSGNYSEITEKVKQVIGWIKKHVLENLP